jgi:hypothetical protein
MQNQTSVPSVPSVKKKLIEIIYFYLEAVFPRRFEKAAPEIYCTETKSERT